MSSTADYHFTRAIAARVTGALLVLLALLLGVVTVVVAIAGLPALVLLVVVVVGALAVLVAGNAVSRRVAVVRLAPDGYRVRLVRGVGVTAAAWTDVEEAVTSTTPHGLPVVVLKLTGGRTSTLPVALLDVDREQFVRDLQEHLQRGQDLRPLA